MGMFDFLKKKEKKDEMLLEEYSRDLSRTIELPVKTETKDPNLSFSSQSQFPQQTLQSSTASQQDRISLIESKLENLRIYLEMINSKLDRLETLLRAKGLI